MTISNWLAARYKAVGAALSATVVSVDTEKMTVFIDLSQVGTNDVLTGAIVALIVERVANKT